jgi:hypothetical protein
VRDSPQKLEVDDVKTKLSWEFFAVRLLCCGTSMTSKDPQHGSQRSVTRKLDFQTSFDSTYIVSRNLKISRSLFRPERMPMQHQAAPFSWNVWCLWFERTSG